MRSCCQFVMSVMLILVFGYVGCGETEEPADTEGGVCNGDGCGEADVVETGPQVCENELEFVFSQDSTKVYVLRGAPDTLFDSATQLAVQLLHGDTGNVIDDATAKPAQGAALALDAAVGIPRLQVRVLLLQEGESQPVASGTSAVYAAGTEAAYVTVYPQGSWAEIQNAITCEPVNAVRSRYGHTVSLLSDGRILVAGGAKPPAIPAFPTDNDFGELYTDLEVYDPTTGTVELIPGGLPEGRVFHTATVLGDGTVLIAGGLTGSVGALNPTSSTLLIDPASDFAVDPTSVPMQKPRAKHGAVYAPELDAVLLVGGAFGSAESDLWKKTGSIPIPTAQNRSFHTLTYIPEVKVAIAVGGEVGETVVNNAELFQLSGSVMSNGLIQLPAAGERTLHGAAYLSSVQKVFFAGGFKDVKHSNLSKDVLEWDPKTNALTYIPFQLAEKRGAPTLVPFDSSNLVLVVGGYSGDGALNSTEAIVVTGGGGGLGVPEVGIFPAPSMPGSVFGTRAVMEGTGRALLWGGSLGDAAAQPILFVYTP